MPSAPTRMTLALAVAALAELAGSCAGKHVNEVWYPIPDQAADSAARAARDVRGTRTAAAAIPNDEDTQIIRSVIVQSYYPVRGQARWVDPRPLAHVRGAPDDTVGADFDWAEEIVALAHRSNVCALDGRLEPNGPCKGKPGGILRFSTPYSTGKDSAVVYAIWAPVDSTGTVNAPKSELQFRLRRTDEGWGIRGKTTVTAGSGGRPAGAKSDTATRPAPSKPTSEVSP